jgi:hypothetical protein
MNINKNFNMKKILVTENQLNMIKKHVNEGYGDERYERMVSVDVETYGVKINGNDIDWVTAPEIRLSFLIELEHRSWGIKDMSLYDIQGPSEIELTITPQVDDAEDVEITVPLNWENVESETQENEGVITVGNEITIKLGNNENGEIVVDSIHVPVYTL